MTHHRLDDPPARRLEAAGIGMHLGCAEHFDQTDLRTLLSRALSDAEWAQSTQDRARRALGEGQGRERIFDAIEKIAATRPKLASPRSDHAPNTGPTVIR